MRAWLAAALVLFAACIAAAEEPLRSYSIRGDAVEASLTGGAGDPARGRELTEDRRRSLCTLCHAVPMGEARAQGTLAPDLRGVGARLAPGQIRLRIIDMRRLEPSSIMPSYYRIDGLHRVAAPWRGKPVLNAEEIEDLVAYLATLKD